MNTVLVRYGHSVRKKTIYKYQNAKYAVEADISMQWLGDTFGIFRRLAAEWRRIAFVYDVIGYMTIATSVDA